MSVLELFSLNPQVEKLQPSKAALEKDLQTLIENNMEKFFNVQFLKSEYKITEGRMDSIGIDENYCPVIFEYKRGVNENVINQGLFYLDWLMDHQGDFKQLVLEKFDSDFANKIDWSSPCVICVASDFTKYDLHAVNQIDRNIKLVRYRKYNENLILFEHLNTPNKKNLTKGKFSASNNSVLKTFELVRYHKYGEDLILFEPNNTNSTKEVLTIPNNSTSTVENSSAPSNSSLKIFEEQLKTAPENLRVIYDEICTYIEDLDDDIYATPAKYWLAYKKDLQNVACITIQNTQVIIYLKLNPETIKLEPGFSENMKGKGHWGTGDLKLSLKNDSDVQKAKQLIERAYNEI